MKTLSTLSAKEIKANGSIEVNHKGDIIVIAWGGECYHAYHKYGVSGQSRLADIKKIVTFKDYEAFDSVDELEHFTWALSNDQIARIHEQAEEMVEPVEFDADSAGDFEPVELTDEHTGGNPFEAESENERGEALALIVQPMINTIANLRQMQAQFIGTSYVKGGDAYELAIRALKSKLLDCYGVTYNRNMATI